MLVAALLLSFAGSASALAESNHTGQWRCDVKFGYCRYLSLETKEQIFPETYERAMPFSEGLAAVSADGRFGYIDSNGKIVIKPAFDLAGPFTNGLAEVLIGRQVGVIDRSGKIKVPPQFGRALPFTKDILLVQEGEWTSGFFQGHERLDALAASSYFLQNAGLYHISGYWVIRPGLSQVRTFDKDRIWAKSHRDSGFGLLASNGRWIIGPQLEYGDYYSTSDDRAVVRKQFDGATYSGAIDGTGRLVIPFERRLLSGFRNGWAIVSDRYDPHDKEPQGLINVAGKLVGGRLFERVQIIDTGDLALVRIDGRWHGLERSGNVVPHPHNGRLFASCPTGLRLVERDGLIEAQDAQGRPTLPFLLDHIFAPPKCEWPITVSRDRKYGFLGLDGRMLLDPPFYDNTYSFTDGHALIQTGGKWGIIDARGTFTMPPKIDQFHGQHKELFRVEVDGQKRWITARGEERDAPTNDPSFQHPLPSTILVTRLMTP